MGGGCLGWSAIVYMSSGMFRGKESSNRNRIISISSRLIEFWCFGLPAALGVGSGWMGVVEGCPLTLVHMHACTRACGKHDNSMQMATPIGGIPGNSL